MTDLYPLKFEPLLKPRPWGGTTLREEYGKSYTGNEPIGESWEICGLAGDESVVSNGFLAGNNLAELLEVYMGDIVGETIYEKFGDEFPLLVKILDAASNLSVQVHPGDEMARRLHHAYGKSEMWYILKAAPGSKIYCGFRKGIEMPAINDAIKHNNISALLNAEEVRPGDFFDIPAGMVHAIGEGVVLAEIQQPSDITYRIFDWNRTDENGNSRELHTDLAIEAINLKTGGGKGASPEFMLNETFRLVSNRWFTTNILSFNTFITKDYNLIDSFVIFMCVSGEFILHWDKGTETVTTGETVLVPAMIRDIVLEPKPAASVLEVYISPASDNRNS